MNGTSRGEIIDEASNWIIGGGIVTRALFPLALPGIVLAVAAALPLVAVALGVALVVAGSLGRFCSCGEFGALSVICGGKSAKSGPCLARRELG
jgi:hypothetical protein